MDYNNNEQIIECETEEIFSLNSIDDTMPELDLIVLKKDLEDLNDDLNKLKFIDFSCSEELTKCLESLAQNKGHFLGIEWNKDPSSGQLLQGEQAIAKELYLRLSDVNSRLIELHMHDQQLYKLLETIAKLSCISFEFSDTAISIISKAYKDLDKNTDITSELGQRVKKIAMMQYQRILSEQEFMDNQKKELNAKFTDINQRIGSVSCACDNLSSKLDQNITDIDNLRANAKNDHKLLESKQDKISDLEKIRDGAALGATAIQEHQDISGKADNEQLDKVNQEVATLQQSLQKTQEDLRKEHQGYEKLKRALIATSICTGTISVGALIALLILIL